MANFAAFAYLVAGVLFILALRGLSHPTTSRQGNRYGMIGMAIAILTTLIVYPPAGVAGFALVALGFAVGGGAGAVIAKRIEMTKMPQLVAAFHSLVGLAAVAVAAAAFSYPEAYGIGARGAIRTGSLIEMGLGTAIGAITFTGSVVAFAKLQGLVSGKPLVFPMQHPLNAALGVLLVLLLIWLAGKESTAAFVLIVLVAFALGFLLILPIGGAEFIPLATYRPYAACCGPGGPRPMCDAPTPRPPPRRSARGKPRRRCRRC